MVRLGSLEFGTVIFWMLFWLANGLAKLIPGTHVGVKFAEKGDVDPFAVTLDKMGWGTDLGDLPSTSRASLNCSSGSSSHGR